jgi:hypothetical protein
MLDLKLTPSSARRSIRVPKQLCYAHRRLIVRTPFWVIVVAEYCLRLQVLFAVIGPVCGHSIPFAESRLQNPACRIPFAYR